MVAHAVIIVAAPLLSMSLSESSSYIIIKVVGNIVAAVNIFSADRYACVERGPDYTVPLHRHCRHFVVIIIEILGFVVVTVIMGCQCIIYLCKAVL